MAKNRSRIKRQKKRPAKNISSLPQSVLSILFFLLLITLLFFLSINFFIIKNVKCVDTQSKAEFDCQQFDSLINKSIFFIDFDKQDELKQVIYDQENSRVYQVVEIKKELPSTLFIFLSEKELSYRIKIEGQGDYLVNIDGQIKENDPNFNLSEVNILSSWNNEILFNFASI